MQLLSTLHRVESEPYIIERETSKSWTLHSYYLEMFVMRVTGKAIATERFNTVDTKPILLILPRICMTVTWIKKQL